MKFFVAIACILASGLASGQRTKDPGLRYPQHATAPKGYKSNSSVLVSGRPTTTSAASDLAKIEQKPRCALGALQRRTQLHRVLLLPRTGTNR
jgi:hypothetical protein